MRVRRAKCLGCQGNGLGLFVVATAALMAMVASPALGATAFDAGGGDAWWFNFLNWSQGSGVYAEGEDPADPPNYLPPAKDIGLGFVDPNPTDVQINDGVFLGAEGVVFDPDNDPYYNDAEYMSQFAFPTGYGPQDLQRFYVGRNVNSDDNPTLYNLLTIKSGDVTVERTIIGRSGEEGNLGRVNQLGGAFRVPSEDLHIGHREESGVGNGIWDYRGGTLDVSVDGGDGIKLSSGGEDARGSGGIGTFIMRNPGAGTGGYVRTFGMIVASYGGFDDDVTDDHDPDGVTRGVGIVEFHYENDGVRPIQVVTDLSINNGEADPTDDNDGTSEHRIRSSRLAFVLDEAPAVDASGVPVPLGLFDVDYSGLWGGVITGTGDIDGNGTPNEDTDQVFSNIDNTGIYSEGAVVEATYGQSTYRWNISYTGNINWSDGDNSVLDTTVGIMHNGVYTGIEGPASGTDVVLIGLDSTIVEGLFGDYNDDGVIDAADYTVWRDALAAGATTLTNDSTPGTVDESDYSYWKAHFGETTPPGAGALVVGAVPEPSTLVLTIFLAVLWMGRGLASRR